jgi:hypothetical protein
MKVRPGLFLFLFLGIPVTAAAQPHQGRQTHPGGMAPHPGGARQQPHMVTPEMQHQHMMQQFWREQMMLNEMMSPRAQRAQTQSRPDNSRSQTKGNQPQPAASQSPNQGNHGTKSRDQGQIRGSSTQSGGTEQQQPNRKNETKSTHDENAAREMHRKNELMSLKKHSVADSKRKSALDQGSISLLRTVHSKLRQADHDYDGHRMRAMNHVASALEHLGSPAFHGELGQNFGLGNLPQSKSDEILRTALVHLKTVEHDLWTGTNHAEHHGSARAKVAEAIGELHIALNIR